MLFYPRVFLTKDDDKKIVTSIQQAERQTSGEIRVHFQKKLKEPLMDEAVATFFSLKMDETREKNGVLFFFVPSQKLFAIIADKGINDKVPENFWEEMKTLLATEIKAGNKVEGICKAISMTGEKLREFFPYDTLLDINELPDEISYS